MEIKQLITFKVAADTLNFNTNCEEIKLCSIERDSAN